MNERAFDHVVVVIFENEYRSYVRANPYMAALAKQGTELASSFGISHPSHANYVSSIAGQLCNVTQDPLYNSFVPCAPPTNSPAPLQQMPIVERIRQKGLRWKAYMEGYQPVQFPPQLDLVMSPSDPTQPDVQASVAHTILDYLPYMNMHNPFVRFASVMDDPAQWACIRPIYEFFTDALNGTLPECSWVVPTLWGDGHYLWGSINEPEQRAPALVDQQAQWLRTFFDVLRIPGKDARLPKRTLVVVTYDEADFESDYVAAQRFTSDYDGPNQVYTVLLGDMVQPGRVEEEGVNHYTILRTIERNFGLDDLGANDADANWLQFLWGRAFRWGAPVATPVEGATFAAAAGRGDALDVVYGTAEGVRLRTFDGRHWGAEQTVAVPSGTTAAELCAIGDTLLLVTQGNGALSAMTLANGAWSQPQTIVESAPGSFALTAYVDHGDGQQKAMLAWSTGGGISSQIYAGGTWDVVVSTGQQTDGDVALAVLGPSLFLIAKAPGSDAMNVVSYNTGDYNVITGTSHGYSDTTRDLWSPSAYPVAHFGRGPTRLGDDELEPLLQPYAGIAPYANATLEGVIHLATNVSGGASDVTTTTFSLSGMLTPLHPVDYASGSTGSNGYGTLAQGGWTLQQPVKGVTNAGTMAMARFGDRLALLTQPSIGGPLQLSVGAYVTEKS